MEVTVSDILKENSARLKANNRKFDPITGEGSTGVRVKVRIADFVIPVQWLPPSMMEEPLVKRLTESRSLGRYLCETIGEDYTRTEWDTLTEQLLRLRCLHDFAFWAAVYVRIKNKGGGADVNFRLTRPQRRFVERLEAARTEGRPIRIVLLKARQWGGSTTSQLYMAWLQLVHKTGLNSLIIAQQTAGSDEIRDMFRRMLESYPAVMLHGVGEEYDPDETKMKGVGMSGLIHEVPQRNCKIKIGTANNPDSCRGGDYNLVHCSEVGIWKNTDSKTPEDIVRSACSGILYKPYTMIVYESTANGTGNFFDTEYKAAKKGISQFEALFVSWFDIDQYFLPFKNYTARRAFAEKLLGGRMRQTCGTDREEPGAYLWWLWEKGATLEAINWYVAERAKYHDHGHIASEYPSDDIEAFVHSGARVFDRYQVETLEKSCRPPKYTGDVIADFDSGPKSLCGVRFTADSQGYLKVWAKPEIDEEELVTERYLAVVDIGGRSNKADWSVITVFDRLLMMEGGRPEVVAQWYGHTDMDLLAWKAAQIATWYDNALLVIESNTLETHDRERQVDGDQSNFLLNQLGGVYPNLYARAAPEDSIVEGRPVKYGFHTNVSTKPMVISTLVKMVRENAWIERDEQCLNEFINYEKKQNGSFGAIKGEHDDLLMTRAIGLHICFFEMGTPRIIKRTFNKAVNRRNTVSAATI